MARTHHGFVGLVELSNGNLMVAYRSAGQHNIDTGSDYGIIYTETSTDDGQTWGSKTAVIDSSGSFDAREPTLFKTADDTILLFYTEVVDATTRTPRVARTTNDGSSWTTAITLTHSFTDFATVSTTAVQTSGGRILAALYGEDAGDTYTSCRVSYSDDDGASWTALSEIVDGQADSRDYQEPCLALLGNGDIVAFIRSDTTSIIYESTSTDNGATWSAKAILFTSTSGRPTPLRTADRLLLLVRSLGSDSYIRTSLDDGSTFLDFETLIVPFSTTVSTYGQMIEMADDVVGLAYSFETSTTNGDVKFTILSDDGTARLA